MSTHPRQGTVDTSAIRHHERQNDRKIRGETPQQERRHLENADKAIQKHETMALNRRDAERFFDAIINPPALNDKLRTAMDEHGKRVASR